MFSSVAHLARANPFNAPHLQLVHDGLTGHRSSPVGPPGPPRRSRNLAAAAVEEYSCEYGSMKFYALCGFGGVLSCACTPASIYHTCFMHSCFWARSCIVTPTPVLQTQSHPDVVLSVPQISWEFSVSAHLRLRASLL
uniref:Uncharacterized protein n=1 Tax=Neovison vison TaxID=452646 RepID=A0A8C7BJP5_NEOVI